MPSPRGPPAVFSSPITELALGVTYFRVNYCYRLSKIGLRWSVTGDSSIADSVPGVPGYHYISTSVMAIFGHVDRRPSY